MGGDEDGFALLVGEGAEETKDEDTMGQIEMGGGFVKKDDRRLLGEGFCDEDTLLLTVGMGVEK